MIIWFIVRRMRRKKVVWKIEEVVMKLIVDKEVYFGKLWFILGNKEYYWKEDIRYEI